MSKLVDRATRLNSSQIANMSGWIRAHQGVRIDTKLFSQLLELKTPALGEKADKLLNLFAKLYPKPGIEFMVTSPPGVRKLSSSTADASLQSVIATSWMEDEDELWFVLNEYLCKEAAFLFANGPNYRISPKGWTHLYSLAHINVGSRIGFVALWFDQQIDAASNTIEAAISAAGYSPLRIDKHPHNNKIDDEIIAGIRRSKFLVADLTGHRGGVYFEAGFAKGLGLEVIWLCRDDDKHRIHFDNRQYCFIFWESDKLDQLKSALQSRIEATLGRGSL